MRAELRARQNLWFSDIDDPIRAIEVVRPGLEKARRLGLREWTFDLTGVIGLASSRMWIAWDWVDARFAELADEGFASAIDRLVYEILRAFLSGMRSDPERQVDALQRVRETSTARDDQQVDLNIAIVMAWALLAAGRPAQAFEQAALVLDSDFGAAWKAWGAAVGIPAAAWAADAAGLARCEESLDRATGRWVSALRVEIGAARSALAGDRATAVPRYLETFGRFRDLGTPLLLAASVIGACRLLGPLPELAPAIAEAREILTGLRAAPLLAQLESAAGAVAQSAPRGRPTTEAAPGVAERQRSHSVSEH